MLSVRWVTERHGGGHAVLLKACAFLTTLGCDAEERR